MPWQNGAHVLTLLKTGESEVRETCWHVSIRLHFGCRSIPHSVSDTVYHETMSVATKFSKCLLTVSVLLCTSMEQHSTHSNLINFIAFVEQCCMLFVVVNIWFAPIRNGWQNWMLKMNLFLLLQRIEQVKSASDGILYGLTENKATLVLGFSMATTSIENNLPIGFKALGTIRWGENLGDASNATEVRWLRVSHLSINMYSLFSLLSFN